MGISGVFVEHGSGRVVRVQKSGVVDEVGSVDEGEVCGVYARRRRPLFVYRSSVGDRPAIYEAGRDEIVLGEADLVDCVPGPLSPVQVLRIKQENRVHRFVFVQPRSPLAVLDPTIDALDLEEQSFAYYVQNNWRSFVWRVHPAVSE
jgi:hypothetical protein